MSEAEETNIDPLTAITIKLDELNALIATKPDMGAIEQAINEKIGPVLDSNRKLFAQASTEKQPSEPTEPVPDVADVLVDAVLSELGLTSVNNPEVE